MNSILHNNFVAASAIASAIFAGNTFLGAPPAIKTTDQSNSPQYAINKTYIQGGTSKTFDHYSSLLSSEFVITSPSIENLLSGIYEGLLAKQVRLDEEFEQILSDNLWDLYAR